MKKLLSTILLSALLITAGYTQQLSKNSLTYGLGFGLSDSDNKDYFGIGPAFMFGYKRDLLKDRIRFSPNLTMGKYRDGMKDGSRDIHYNTLSLNLAFEFDILRYKAVSVTAETGPFLGSTTGLKGTGTEFDGVTSATKTFTQSESIKHTTIGAIAGLGLRIAPLKSRYAVKITPLNIHKGSGGLTELHSFISLDLKLVGAG